jgi:hypothetical protein
VQAAVMILINLMINSSSFFCRQMKEMTAPIWQFQQQSSIAYIQINVLLHELLAIEDDVQSPISCGSSILSEIPFSD